MFETADLLAYKEEGCGTYLQLFLQGQHLREAIEGKRIRKAGVQLDDGRRITVEQRKKAYATLGDIAAHTGYFPEELKEIMKYIHIARTGCPYFSLSDCSVDTVREFINTILDQALYMGVILTDAGVNRTDDINSYLYSCLKRRRCAVCGRDGEVHHWDAIGMGNDRRACDDSCSRKICLCREHHTIAHAIGREAFAKRYKVYGMIVGEWVSTRREEIA